MIKATYLDHMGEDMDVADAARVSFAKKAEGYSDEKNHKLIQYLAREGHIAPFGHCYLRFHIKAPIFVARQLVKHKFMRMSEVSRRYVDSEPELYVPDVWRGRSADKKQGSDGVSHPPTWLDSTMNQVLDLYDQMIHDGVAPEQARMVLPQSTMTEWWWSGSLDAFADMCRLRCKPDAQAETRIVANQISADIKIVFPVAWAALMSI